MKLLTFLGTQAYEEVVYVLPDGREYKTPLFPEALAAWYEPDEVLVFLTSQAKEHENWRLLQKRLTDKVKLTPVDIPAGSSEKELWQIFTQLTECLNEGDKVIFDVTHAFRSLPILVLLAGVYLRVAKGVELKAMLYGAYVPRSGEAPVFDLTPFLHLIDWTTATARFINTGDAQELAELLQKAHRLPWQSSSVPSTDLPRHLQMVATTLENLSRALLLSRPLEVAEHATTLVRQLHDAAPEVERWARPFSLLLKRVEETFSPLTTGDLRMQLDLIRWYLKLERIAQAIILAREWVISWVCRALGVDLLDRAVREEVERAINQALRDKRGIPQSPLDKEPRLLVRLRALPSFPQVVETWGQINDLRNDVAHCGMRNVRRPAKAIVRDAKKIAERLGDLLSTE